VYQGKDLTITVNETGERHPLSWKVFKKDKNKMHPTQKPVALMEYLIRTYTNPGELVLDFVMGSGTTGVACVNTGRNFIGIEIDEGYFEIAKKRIEQAARQLLLLQSAGGPTPAARDGASPNDGSGAEQISLFEN
jgi:site-specific DNA-methyltransferase (adenine-specific)